MAMLTPATLTSEKKRWMDSIFCRVSLLIPVSAVPKAGSQEEGPMS
jgi:hypothetical protein